jgi:hypothetical protein
MLRSSMDCHQHIPVNATESRAGVLEKFLGDCQVNEG